MTRYLLVLLCGCAMSPKQVEALRTDAESGNASRFARAVSSWHDKHAGAVELRPGSIDLYRPGQQQERAEIAVGEPVAELTGLRPNEHVWRDPGSQHLGFDIDVEHGCGRMPIAPTYRYFREADGRVAVVRIVPEVHERRVHVASCGYGCGTMQADDPAASHSVIDLAVTDPAQVGVAEVRYRYDDVVEECDHPVPAP